MERELELTLVVVPELEPLAAERVESDFWSGNTGDEDLERAWRREGSLS